MVAIVTVPHNIRRALNYNEQKVQQEKAECLYANDFLKEADNLNFYEKLERFEQLNDLNKRAATNTLHVSLNFDPSEKFSKEQMIAIAKAYLEKIGFGDQPYLGMCIMMQDIRISISFRQLLKKMVREFRSIILAAINQRLRERKLKKNLT